MRALLVMLGGADYPAAPALAHAAFRPTSNSIRELLCDPPDPFVRDADALDLFNSAAAWPDQIIGIRDWLKGINANPQDQPTDLIIHYVGHGAFRPNSLGYYLTINKTDAEEQADTSISLAGLRSVLARHAGKMRIHVIVDACFAGAAFSDLQSPDALRLKVAAQVEGIIGTELGPSGPDRGIAFLCSSDRYETSSASGEDGLTQFGSALTSVLRTGDPASNDSLSLARTLDLVQQVLEARHEDPVRPVLYSKQQVGRVADVPLFPNRARKDVASVIVTIGDDTRAKLNAKSLAFAIDLLSDLEPHEVEKRIGAVAEMGGRELRDAGQGRWLVQADESGLSTVIRQALFGLDNVDPSRAASNVVLRLVSRWIRRAPSSDTYVRALQRAQGSEAGGSLIRRLAIIKDEFLIANAHDDARRSEIWTAMGRLEQIYILADAVSNALDAEVTAIPPARQNEARNRLIRVKPVLQARKQEISDSLKDLLALYTTLDSRKAGRLSLIKAIDRTSRVISTNWAKVIDGLNRLAQLSLEGKMSNLAAEEVNACFPEMRNTLLDLEALHDRVRGVT